MTAGVLGCLKICIGAFAVVPASAPGPITINVRVIRCWSGNPDHNQHRWLWVPAFAGMTRKRNPYTGSAIEYFTWLSAKLDSIEAMPSSRVSLFFRNAS
jgi:hypothetical protein